MKTGKKLIYTAVPMLVAVMCMMGLPCVAGTTSWLPSTGVGNNERGRTGASGSRDRAQEFIDEKMEEEPLRSGLCGILAVTAGGDTLAEYGSLRKLLPASNTKLITTGLAMRGLGPGYRFTTRLGYSGQIRDGVLHGDLYIIGGGDPTIASGDKMALSTDSLFSVWKTYLTKAGIRRIDGRVIGDGRFFDGPIENDSWSYGDLGTDYGTGGNGLCFYRNVLDIKALPGAIGERVNVSISYPQLPWLELRNDAVTAPAGTGDNLYLFNTDLATVAEMRGSLAVDKGSRKEVCSNKFGALTCAWYFSEYLGSRGLEVTGGSADIDNYGNIRSAVQGCRANDSKQETSAAGRQELPVIPGSKRLTADWQAVPVDSLTVIGEFRSPTIMEIARVTNSRSDNFYAETLLRMLSKERTGSASYDSCEVVIFREMDSLGVDTGHGLHMVDGSGLARHNYIAPDFFCRFLKAMYDSPVRDQYMSVIARPGQGTMTARAQNISQEDRQRIRMKSGSMNGVLCFSGYILPVSGQAEDMVIFSIMTNNCPDDQREVKIFIDRLLFLLVSASGD